MEPDLPGNADKYNLAGLARVVLDGSGGVILAGSAMFVEHCSSSIALAAGLTRDGRELWHKWIDASNTVCGLAVADLTLASSGDAVVLSREYVPSGPYSVFSMSCIQHNSHLTSEASEPLTGVCNNMPFALACDHDGSIVVSGYNQRVHNEIGPIAVPELLTVKYSPSLHELWRRSSYIGEARAMALTPDGSSVVTGRIADHGTNDILTVQYNP